jgi:ABC-2 type transport system permease protein
MNIIGLTTVIAGEIQRFTRVWIQSLISPWINALLYILIFGVVVGSRIDLIAGISYIDFVLPGIVMLSLINSAYMQGAFSLYFKRFARHIEELLVSPLSHFELLVGFLAAGIVRGLVVGLGVYAIAIFFTTATIAHLGLFIFYSVAVSIIFSLIGIIIGLWSDNFEQLSILSTFVITPLTFLGGVFNSITMLPENAQTLVRFNPFFYFVDGLRYSMIGVSEANTTIGFVLIIGLIILLGGITLRLFSIGWRIRS